jgi:ABC-type uncharacterized transport system permease subunit
MEIFGLIVVLIAIFVGLYFVGSLFNKEGHEDFRFGVLSNVVYGLLAVIVIAVILRIIA